MSARQPVQDWTSDFDHFDSRWISDPYSIFEELRQSCPVAHTSRYGGVYLPTTYEDIRNIAYDTENFSNRRIIVRDGPPAAAAPPVTSDPPQHREERLVLLPAFTAEAVATRLEPSARASCKALIAKIAGRRSCDASLEFCQQMSIDVIARLIGVPSEDGELFGSWIHIIQVAGVTDPEALRQSTSEMESYFRKQISSRGEDGGQRDLIGLLLAARVGGERLSEAYILGTLRIILAAGIESTWCALGACLWHLATHADDRRRLVSDRSMIPTAIEEFLRAYAPVNMARLIVKDTKIGECPARAGEMVFLSYPAANRDPTVFPEADRVLLDRAQNPHVAFGLGIHRCIGSNLARMEMRVALSEWLEAFPEFCLDPSAEVEWSQGMLRGPRRLPLLIGG